jgi:integrase
MASISTDKDGRRIIQFVGKDRKRRTVHLGEVTMRIAEEFRLRIERLAAAVASGVAADPETVRWLGTISDEYHSRLASPKVGLTEPRISSSITLKQFIKDYIASRPDFKSRTRLNMEGCGARLVKVFGDNRLLASINEGHADECCAKLRSEYASATASCTIRKARQFFKAASRKGLIAKSPFAECKAGHQSNKARGFFISREAAEKVLAACPDSEWRLMFALARFGGLRTPSETLHLTWADVDWEHSRFRVHASKKEAEESGGDRWVPIFPELLPHLEEAFELAADGAEYVITRSRNPELNLRTGLKRILRRAGLSPWPRLWHNLRATRETELAAAFPLHVVCSWIGHRPAVAAEHYLQVTDADFERAAKSAARALQNSAQSGAGPGRVEVSEKQKTPEKPGLAQTDSVLCGATQDRQVSPTGVEPVTSAFGGQRSIQLSYGDIGRLKPEQGVSCGRLALATWLRAPL